MIFEVLSDPNHFVILPASLRVTVIQKGLCELHGNVQGLLSHLLLSLVN